MAYNSRVKPGYDFIPRFPQEIAGPNNKALFIGGNVVLGGVP